MGKNADELRNVRGVPCRGGTDDVSSAEVRSSRLRPSQRLLALLSEFMHRQCINSPSLRRKLFQPTCTTTFPKVSFDSIRR